MMILPTEQINILKKELFDVKSKLRDIISCEYDCDSFDVTSPMPDRQRFMITDIMAIVAGIERTLKSFE